MTEDVAAQLAVIPVEDRTCNWCPSHDPVTHEPLGEQCGTPATHVVEWYWCAGHIHRWSFACDEHSGPPGIDPSGAHGWAYVVTELESAECPAP